MLTTLISVPNQNIKSKQGEREGPWIQSLREQLGESLETVSPSASEKRNWLLLSLFIIEVLSLQKSENLSRGTSPHTHPAPGPSVTGQRVTLGPRPPSPEDTERCQLPPKPVLSHRVPGGHHTGGPVLVPHRKGFLLWFMLSLWWVVF